MKAVTPHQLLEATPEAAAKLLCTRFRRLRARRRELTDLLLWQSRLTPNRPEYVSYFRWHLPRYLETLHLLESALPRGKEISVLDLATFAPFSLLMETFFAGLGLSLNWVRTSSGGGPEAFEGAERSWDVRTVPLRLGTARFPFEDKSRDVVLFTEVIEHLQVHPQHTLLEINRVLRAGGHLLITTPNVGAWKKVLRLSEGTLEFDSPTFGSDWCHRFEYSFYSLRALLNASGFSAVTEFARDVYCDDPHSVRDRAQWALFASAKLLTGDLASAARFVMRRGSTLFFLYTKNRDVDGLTAQDYVPI